MSFFSRISGLLGSGLGKNIRTTATGDLGVEIGGVNVSAFGDLISTTIHPIFQYDFVHASTPNSQLMVHTVANSATIGVSSSKLQLQTGTNSAGSALHCSRKLASYRPGQGNVLRFTHGWATSAASSTQIAGAGNTDGITAPTDGYFFGFNGATFGINHRINSVDHWAGNEQSNWNHDVCDGSNSANNPSGFNLNKTLGNVFQIVYGYLGYGDIKFYVQNALTGLWILVHIIRYANSSVSVQSTNPSMRFVVHLLNAGNTANLTSFCGSVGMFLSGLRDWSGPIFGVDARQATNSANTESLVMTIAAATTYNGVPCRGVIRLRSLSFSANTANADMRIRMRRNQPITSPTWLAVNGTIVTAPTLTGNAFPYQTSEISAGESLVFQDVSATLGTAPGPAAPTGASNVIFNCTMAGNNSQEIDLTPFDLFMQPGEQISFCQISGASNSVADFCVNWQSDI